MKPFVTVVTCRACNFWLRGNCGTGRREWGGRGLPEAIREQCSRLPLEPAGCTRSATRTREAGLHESHGRRSSTFSQGSWSGQCAAPSRHLGGFSASSRQKRSGSATSSRNDPVAPLLGLCDGLPQCRHSSGLGQSLPTSTWVKKQTDTFLLHAAAQWLKVGLINRDRDKLYRNNFDQILKVQGVDTACTRSSFPESPCIRRGDLSSQSKG